MGNDAGNKLEAPKLGFRRRKSGATESEAPEPTKTETESRAQPEKKSEKKSEKESGPRLLNAVVRRAAKPDAEPEAKRETATERIPVKEPATAREVPISDGPLAAALVGLVVGIFLVAAVWVCEQISQQSRGTTSLGRAGAPLLLAIFVLAVVGGTLLLRLAKTPSPGSISFLATALVAVLALLFIGDRDSLWAGIGVVILAVAAFVLARWVTVRYIDADTQ